MSLEIEIAGIKWKFKERRQQPRSEGFTGVSIPDDLIYENDMGTEIGILANAPISEYGKGVTKKPDKKRARRGK